MKVIIAGSRSFNDYEFLKKKLREYLPSNEPVEIVSGTASGADRLGERYAKEYGLQLKEFPANWKEHGKSAGFRRNNEMALYADSLIAFWDGKSKGTKNMISLATNLGLNMIVFVNNEISEMYPEPNKDSFIFWDAVETLNNNS